MIIVLPSAWAAFWLIDHFVYFVLPFVVGHVGKILLLAEIMGDGNKLQRGILVGNERVPKAVRIVAVLAKLQ